jgi:thiosulfate reductase cytochrome b subunit
VTPPRPVERQGGVQKHALPVRIAHWSMALAILIMIGSGWRIYNASPILPFRFPEWATLGGDVDAQLARHGDPGVATAIAWHLAGMWLLFASYGLFVLWGIVSGHFGRDFLPVSPRAFWRDFVAAARFRLEHRLGEYNAVQKVFYWGVVAAVLVMIVSGFAIWKPVQTYPLELLFGGFQGARLIHFLAMSAIVGFLVVHLALVALVPSTLVAMIVGRFGHPPAAPVREPGRAGP